MLDLIQPNWPVSNRIKAYTTTRHGGVSKTPFDTLNMAADKGDDATAVAKNRAILREALHLPNEPFWLTQVHGIKVVPADSQQTYVEADASYTRQVNNVCAVQTADCLPILLCDRDATCVAAIHAGWKGLAAGIIEQAIKTLQIAGQELLVWLGPAIGPQAFEVGEEVYQLFTAYDAKASQCFNAVKTGKWLADIYALARQRLHACNVTAMYGGEFCTYTQQDKFFSFRRDQITGRMASLIWLAEK